MPIAGVWTPWADVLCRNCHDAVDLEVTSKRKIKWPGNADPTAAADRREWREGDGQGFCTKCGVQIWVQEEIAQLTRIRALAGGEMEQTGGMCAALTFTREDGGAVVVTAMDGPIVIGLYKSGEWGSGEALCCYTLPSATPDEAAAAIIRVCIAEMETR